MNDSPLKMTSSIKKNKSRLITFTETFQSSLFDKTEKFTLDKTLVNGIKQNDPSKIIENAEEADLGQTSQIYDQKKEVSSILVNTRKRFDQTKQLTSKIQLNIDKLKKDKEKLETQKTKLETFIKDEQKIFKQIQTQYQRLNEMCDSAQYYKDIRLQMSEVLKQDILHYKKNCFQANIKIVRNHNRIKTLTGQFQSSKRVSSNCRSLVYSIEKKIIEKQHERFDKISSYQEVLTKKMENNDKREQRQKMMHSSMLEALTGKMPEELQQRKLLLAHLVLKRLLRVKMEKEMEKHSLTESAFRKIQQNTTVKRAEQFVQKFINRQKNYGQLLDNISKNEEKIGRLKQEKQTLQKENQQILYQKQTIQDLEMEKKNLFNSEISSNIDSLRQRLTHIQRLFNRVFIFTSQKISSFDNANLDSVKKALPRSKPHLSLKQLLQRINKYFDSIGKSQIQNKLKQIYSETNDLMPKSVRKKNLRIKTLTSRTQHPSQIIEDQDAAYDDLSQIQFLNHNRKMTKKSVYLRSRLKTKPH